MKYKFRRNIETVKELLQLLGRTDIPSPEVSIARESDSLEVDFGIHMLSPTDEGKLTSILGSFGFKRVPMLEKK